MVRSGCWMNEIVIWNFGVFNEKWGCLTHAVVLLCWHFFSHWNYQGTDCLTPNNNIILVKKWKCSQCCSLIVTRSGGNWLKCSGESVGFLLFSFTGSHSEFTLNGWLFFFICGPLLDLWTGQCVPDPHLMATGISLYSTLDPESDLGEEENK